LLELMGALNISKFVRVNGRTKYI